MSKKKRQLILSTFVQQYGTHANAWRRSETKAGGNPDFNEWASTVQLLERGKFDIAFFADFVGNSGADTDRVGRHPQGGGFEPLTLTAALSQVTRHIGLVATVNTNFAGNTATNVVPMLANKQGIGATGTGIPRPPARHLEIAR
jgi:hypothetical protein